jgi:hypothetical protein
MTPQEFIEWGRRIADGYAEAASRLDGNQRAHEFDGDSLAAYEFLNKSNEIARAFTIPGGQEALALTPALLHLQSQDSEEAFCQVFQALQPVLSEILDGMWLGEWEFNDSGLVGTLKIDRESAPGKMPFRVAYIDSQGTTHEAAVARDDEEYGMSYESLHIEIKNYSSPAWKIHAFLFRWDRQKMAGIVDHGETEGRHSFYAVKKVRHGPPPLPPRF